MACFALQARYVFPIDRPPLEAGLVTIEGERIVAVGENRSGQPPLDLGNVALLPGLVNAHTHLEFSELDQPLGVPGNSLPEWIPQVVAYRRARGSSDDAVRQGLREAARTGTTTVGEIATLGWSQSALESLRLDVTVFEELIGLAPAQMEPLWNRAHEHWNRTPSAGFDWSPGISPHAPYSINSKIVARLARHAPPNTTLAMHVAESPEELQLLRSGRGPFQELLERLGVWEPKAFSLGARPLDYLQLLRHAPRVLVVHGNYLERDELQLLAWRKNMSLVYCPRTHAFFQHPPYPLAEALRLGVRVAVGTDSRASNPDLNLLSELRQIARMHPEVPLPDVLRLGTQNGAAALGRDEVGTLAPGKLANLVAVTIENFSSGEDPHAALLHGAGQAVQTWYRGVALD